MSVALRGNLGDFGIADVFQLIGQQRKTGILELRGEGGHVEVRFDRGAVVSAAPVRAQPHDALCEMLVRAGLLEAEQLAALRRESLAAAQSVPALAIERGWLDPERIEEIEDLVTRETFFAILRWRSGAFDFRAQPVLHARAVDALHGAEQILMDGLRMLDEWQSFAHAVPSEALVFAPAGGSGAWRVAAAGAVPQAALERVFGLVDGRSDVRRVIDRSRLGTFDAVRALAELRRAGIIAVCEPAGAHAQAPPARARARRGVSRAALAAAAPLALLLLVAGAALAGRGAPAPRAGFPILASPLAAARAAHATRGLRQVLAAERFASGRLPASPDALAAPARAMAAPGSRPYYYRALGSEGAVLLAPER
jgi:hypothetical protein